MSAVNKSNIILDTFKYVTAAAIVVGSKGALAPAAVKIARDSFQRLGDLNSPFRMFQSAAGAVGKKLNFTG